MHKTETMHRAKEKQQPANRQKYFGRTGIPEKIREKYEAVSGLSFDDVRVHYNSHSPLKIGAYAYTQGSDIYIAPGQERHLEHELGHVVQQKRGLVRPNAYINGMPLNTDPGLEAEADRIGKM